MTIMQKIISANDQHSGSVIQAPKAAKTDSYGDNYTVHDQVEKVLPVADGNTQLDDHFDDPRYYTGDAVT